MKGFYFLILFVCVALPARAKLAALDPELQVQRLVVAQDLYAKQDVNALIRMLETEHLFIQTDIALKLGRLGADQALPILRVLDQNYSNFACSESGQFGVAILLIENKTTEAQKKALLAVATEDWAKGPHAQSVINIAGRELSRFYGDDISLALKDINTYGAQYTVLSHKCKKGPETEAISLCIKVLHSHETPQKAEAAQELLVAFGFKAKSPVEKLKQESSGTVQSRCVEILGQINLEIKKSH